MSEPAAPQALAELVRAAPVSGEAGTVPSGPQRPAGLASSGGGGQLYGMLGIAGVAVALPLSALREVVPCPPSLAPLPAAVPGLLGALELRSMIVPVLDLRPRLALPGGSADTQAVVVFTGPGGAAVGRASGTDIASPGQSGGSAHPVRQVLGLLVDQVGGIVAVPAHDLLPVDATHPGTTDPGQGGADGSALLFTHAFRGPGTGAVTSVLDPDRLLSMPGLPRLRQAGPERQPPPAGSVDACGRTGASAPQQTLAVLQCGPYLLGIDVEHVHTTTPGAALQPSVLTGPVCRGAASYRARQVPVLDLLALLGLTNSERPARTGAGLVLEVDDGFVIADVDALLDLVRIRPDDVLSVPAVAVGRPDLLHGVVDLPGRGTCVVLDGGALRADPTLRALTRLNTDTDRAADAGTHRADPATTSAPESARADVLTGPEYLVYSSGGVEMVTPLTQIDEIMPVPDRLTVTGADTAVLGMTVHRGQALAVASLDAALDLPATQPTTCLLLVAGAGAVLALAVDGLHSIARLSWTDTQPGRATPVGQPWDGLRSCPLVTVGQDGRLLPEVDLHHVARRIHTTGRQPGPPDSPER